MPILKHILISYTRFYTSWGCWILGSSRDFISKLYKELECFERWWVQRVRAVYWNRLCMMYCHLPRKWWQHHFLGRWRCTMHDSSQPDIPILFTYYYLRHSNSSIQSRDNINLLRRYKNSKNNIKFDLQIYKNLGKK